MHHRPRDLLETIPQTGVLQPKTETDRVPRGTRLVVGQTHRVKAGTRACTATIHDLAGAPHHTGFDDVARAHLPPRDAHHGCQTVHHPFHRELRLIRAETSERPAHRVVGAHRNRLDVDGRHHIWPGCMTGCAFEHLHPHRRIRARVAQHAHLQCCQPAIGVACSGVLHLDRMAFRMHQQRFFTAESDAHRSIEQPRGERRLALIRHVFFAAERSPIAHQFGDDERRINIQHARNVVAVIPDALTTRVHHETTLIARVATGHRSGEG